MADQSSEPLLSVVITITSGVPHLARCLAALESQLDPPSMEILVPFHPAVDDVEALRRAYPSVHFILMQTLPPGAGSSDPGLMHLMYDHRRAAGLRAARGQLVAMTEDHAIPERCWCAQIVKAHRQPHGIIGGAIENASPGTLNRALYYCDFGRYQRPRPEGPAGYVSDINVSYKKATLEKARDVWCEFYHETAVHAALRARGETLWLSPEMVVSHDRGELSLPRILAERLAWARLFAGRRAQAVSVPVRVLLALLSPLLPFVLVCRYAMRAWRRSGIGSYIAVLPLIGLLVSVWACGELIGYVTARPTKRRPE